LPSVAAAMVAAGAEASTGAEDFLADMRWAVEDFAAEAAGSPAAAPSVVALAGVHFAGAAISAAATAVSVAATTDADGAGTDSVSA